MVAMTDRFYSTMRMRYVGRVLSEWRGRAGLTGDVVAERLNWARSKISKLENASQTITPADVISMAVVYGVSETERDELVDEVQHATERGWWLSYGDAVTAKQFDRYVDFESEAIALANFEIDLIPGLLQTEDYAHASVRTGFPDATDEEAMRRVALRLARQQILNRPRPPRLWLVIDETALRRPAATTGASVMRAQIDRLIEAAGQPDVTLQVLPFSAGLHPAMYGPFRTFRFDAPELPDIVYAESMTSAYYIDQPDEVGEYVKALDRICAQAAPPAETANILTTIRKEI
jgi:transcriptional regulator with XRE-family HTH domain